MDEQNIEKARKQLVAKRNDFIQESRYNLSRVQNQAILYIISKVQPKDEPGKQYVFQCSEFFALMRYKTDSYTEIKSLLQSIRNISWWKDAENDDEDDILMAWFDMVHANSKKGTITITFHRDIYPYIIDLQKQKLGNGDYYTSYQLQNVILMKHYYSQRLYEILKSYQYNNKTWKFELGTGSKHDLQRRLANVDPDTKGAIISAGWNNFAIFNRDVLKPAKADINKYTDIKIDYEPSKFDFAGNKHRKYVSITFVMVEKTPGEKAATDEYIDAEYREIDDDTTYHQMTFAEVFLKNHEEVINSEKKEKKQLKEEEPKKSFISAFTACFNDDFTTKEIESLYSAACKHIIPGTIEFYNRELWAIDYVSHYKEWIDATPDDTKTTTYKRLLDCVRKDYDDILLKITETYDKSRHAGNMYVNSMESYINQISEEVQPYSVDNKDSSFEGVNSNEVVVGKNIIDIDIVTDNENAKSKFDRLNSYMSAFSKLEGVD